MKFLSWLLLVLSLEKYVMATVFVKAPPKVLGPPKPHPLSKAQAVYTNFVQILDHFSSSGSPVYWNQRAWYNNELVNRNNPNTPVFLMVEGEGTASPGWLNGGAWYEYARQYGAMLFLLEHRYYGESRPTADTSTANLRYLTSWQALGDISNFIRQMNRNFGFVQGRNKWILFGGSYPGDLVAWARLKYPQDVYGAISSSGPLRAKADFYEYNNVVRQSLDYYVNGCSSVVTQAMKAVQAKMQTDAGRNEILQKFQICQGYYDHRSSMDRQLLYETASGYFGNIVQYNEQNNNQLSIRDVCNNYFMNTNLGSPLDRLVRFQADQRRAANRTGCGSASYSSSLSYYRSTAWNSPIVASNTRQWMYQCCNEFGFYQTSPFTDSLFSNTQFVGFSSQMCTDMFGSQFNYQQLMANVDRTNAYYGGTNINVNNVVFVQGSIDPWHALGQVQNTAEHPYVLIDGTSHCYDMLSSAWFDSGSLKYARSVVSTNIRNWLS